jgi:dTDP-4-amino-4,6-dideoxygalactose transaminase
MTTLAAPQLAVNGGTPTRTRPWPKWPIWDDADVESLVETARSGRWFGPTGTQVKEFGERWAAYQQARFCVPCTNGTHALELALRAAGVRAEDEVIVPPYTFIASASAVVHVNAVPLFADVELDTGNLDPAAVEAAITPRTRAILAVHIAGCPADMDRLGEIARRHDLLLIEDAAQAHGAEWRERRVGALGHAGTFSFQASKNLNAGEGGAILTNDPAIFDRTWSLVNVGRVREGGWYEHGILSGNYRMTEWQAAILNSQLARLDEQTARRNQNALYLARQLAEIPGISPARRDPRITRHAYHLFLFRYDAAAFNGLSRDDFLRYLAAEGVPCSRGYTPLYRSDAFRVDADTHPFAGRFDYKQVCLPAVERLCDEAVWLGQSLLLADRDDMDDVVGAVRKIQDAQAR